MNQERGQYREEHKEDWTMEQDALIRNLVSLYGTHDWAIIAENVNSRLPGSHKSGKECSRRWQDFLNGAGAKEPWTEQEELNMLIAHKRFKNKWSEMAEFLKGRSNNTIKNKFYSVFRKIKGKIQKNDYAYDSKLELLEIYYIISLIEYYLAHPTMCPKTKGKRGKDFIYSLIHNLTPKMVQDYKEHIQELAKHEGTMEDLFNELSSRHRPSNDTVVTMHQTPTRPHPEEPDKNVRIEVVSVLPPVDSRTTVRSDNVALSLEEDEFFKNSYKDSGLEASPLFEPDPVPPPSLFSPPPLSAGPAAAAAGAARAACFGHSIGGFSDASTLAKAITDERTDRNSHPPTIRLFPRPPQVGPFQEPNGNMKRPMMYQGFQARSHYYYSQQ